MRSREFKKAFSFIRVNRRHSRTVSFFALFAVACTKSPTDSKGLSIAGSVKLVGQSDHGGTTVALYALVELDTMVVRLNREFPVVGIPISQAKEFDHRLAKQIHQMQTKADGAIRGERIKKESYNLVAIKKGLGWKYLYEVRVMKWAEKANAENTMLHQEIEVNGTPTSSW